MIIFWARSLTANGPAVIISKRYPPQHPAGILVPRASGATRLSRCKKGTAQFLQIKVQNFIKHYECRGTKLGADSEAVSVT